MVLKHTERSESVERLSFRTVPAEPIFRIRITGQLAKGPRVPAPALRPPRLDYPRSPADDRPSPASTCHDWFNTSRVGVAMPRAVSLGMSSDCVGHRNTLLRP